MHMIPSRKIIKLGQVYKTVDIDTVVRMIGILKNAPTADGEAAGEVVLPDMEQAKAFVRQAVQNLVGSILITLIVIEDKQG